MNIISQQSQQLSRAVAPRNCALLPKPRSLTTSSLSLRRSSYFGATFLRVHQSLTYTGLPQLRPVHRVVAAWQQPQLAAQAAGLGRGLFGFWLPVLLVLCLTLTSLAASFVAFVLYIRPVLKAAERAATAAEVASRQMEVAAKEMEKAAVVMSGDLPVMLLEVEKASKEFEVLGRQLNRFTRILTQSPAEAVVSTTSSIQENTLNGIQRVVDDVSSLANAKTWISRWRSRPAAGGEDGGPVAPLPPAPPRATGDTSEREQFRVEAPWEQPPKKKDGLQGTAAAGAAAAAAGAATAAVGTPKLRPGAAASTNAQAQQQQQQQQRFALHRVEQAQPQRAAGKEQAGAVAGGAVRAPAMGQEPPQQQQGNIQDPAATQRSKQGSSPRSSAAAMKAAVVAQVRAGGGGRNTEERAATAAVLAALERAQRAAEQAATATGALQAANDREERKGAVKGKPNEGH